MKEFNWLIHLDKHTYVMTPASEHVPETPHFYFYTENITEADLFGISFDNLSLLHPGYPCRYWVLHANTEHLEDLAHLTKRISTSALLEIALATPEMVDTIHDMPTDIAFATLGLDYQNWARQFYAWVKFQATNHDVRFIPTFTYPPYP